MGFYGHPETHKRYEAWRLLRRLSLYDSVAWLCAGDFNEILDLSKKYRACGRPRSQIEDFKNTFGGMSAV
jgi:endonuclease/exonuclease/phosphatase family metal-dependent hydrolase